MSSGVISSTEHLGNTASKKRRSGGEPLVSLRPIWPARESFEVNDAVY